MQTYLATAIPLLYFQNNVFTVHEKTFEGEKFCSFIYRLKTLSWCYGLYTKFPNVTKASFHTHNGKADFIITQFQHQ